MQVRKADSWVLRFPFIHTSRDFDGAETELIGVTLTSDTGETGLGFTFTSDFGGGRAVKALIDEVMLPRVVGANPNDYPKIWQELRLVTHRLGRGVSMMGIAAIDIALWDLIAKGRGVPLAQALGQAKDALPAYGSGKASPLLPVDELVELSAGYVEQGFRAVKLRVGMDPQADVDRVGAVRAAVGPDVRLMCDANERLDVATALWLGNRLARHDVYWLEEPLVADDVEGHRRLVESLPMAVAVGEHLFSRWEFTPYVERRAADVLQPDACMAGGVTETMRVGELAAAHGLPIAPHFMTELHIHIAAALPNSLYVEYFPFMEHLLTDTLEVKDGQVLVPQRPGHGIAFKESAWAQYRIA